jgi:hypothetical protein
MVCQLSNQGNSAFILCLNYVKILTYTGFGYRECTMEKTKQIFEYLLAAKNMTTPPIRDYKLYEYARFEEDLPFGEGFYRYGMGEDPEAWIEIHKQVIENPPKVDDIFKLWIKTDYTNENIMPEVHNEIKKKNSKMNAKPRQLSNQQLSLFNEDNDVEYFKDNEERVKKYNTWLAEWQQWAKVTKHRKIVQEHYTYFFALFQRFEREGEILDLSYGHGMLRWDTNQGRISHPILVTRLELNFNPKKGIFTLKPTDRGTVLEIEMLSGVDIPNVPHIQKLRNSISQEQLTYNELKNYDVLFNEFVQTLDPNGKVGKDQGQNSRHPNPYLFNKPVIFLRIKSGQSLKEELQNIIEAIESGCSVPRTIQALVQPEMEKQDSKTLSKWSRFGEDLLFPLPANEDQKEIARRLAANYGVVVQGPPGTGKSHTIVNLISHLLAHGKKVLVTSHTERALRVLSEKIPKQIRSVCVSLLGGD